MQTRLDRIETRLQQLFESSLYLLPGNLQPAILIHQLVQTLEQALIRDADGNLTASNTYIISVHPTNAAAWQSNPDLLPALSRVLEEAASEAGVHFSTTPRIELRPDGSQPLDRFTVSLLARTGRLGQTSAMPAGSSSDAVDSDPRPPASFLIIGNRTIPLRLAVINIGRRSDNQLVLDDLRVSRVHAQLRAIHRQYTLFDLNSTGGTFINGVRISQQGLKAGDVISLAGFSMIYGEDTTPARTIEDTHNQTLS